MSEAIEEYDERGNLIHFKGEDGFEYWNEYDKNNNNIHLKSSLGYESWGEYDENNKLIHCKNSKGYEAWYKWKYNEKIEISQKEFEQIKRNKENVKSRELINNSKISRFSLMDI